MTGYDFHPEARFDLDEIWEYIRADNLDASDRVIAGNPCRHSRLSAFSQCWPQPTRPHIAAPALHFGARISDCLRAGRKAPLGGRGDARSAQPRVMAAILRGRE